MIPTCHNPKIFILRIFFVVKQVLENFPKNSSVHSSSTHGFCQYIFPEERWFYFFKFFSDISIPFRIIVKLIQQNIERACIFSPIVWEGLEHLLHILNNHNMIGIFLPENELVRKILTFPVFPCKFYVGMNFLSLVEEQKNIKIIINSQHRKIKAQFRCSPIFKYAQFQHKKAKKWVDKTSSGHSWFWVKN